MLWNDGLRQALVRIAWSDREPIQIRQYAMDRLLADDPAFFWASADSHIESVDQWPAMEYLFALALEHHHQPFTRTAIRSYARVSRQYADDQRPEKTVIVRLNPGVELCQVIFDVFEEPGDRAHQLAAWELLCRVMPAEQRRRKLLGSTSSTLLVADLQAGMTVLDRWPATREQVAWLQLLRHGDWSSIKQMVAKLNPSQRAGLAVRHLSVLARQGSHTSELALPEALEGRQHVDRKKTGVRRTTPLSQRWDDGLAWADVWVMSELLKMMDDRALTAQLFRQADADLADTTAEHGGVLTPGHVTAFMPWLRRHDHVYYATPACIAAMRHGLAHYHFHTQAHDNADYAGPGAGDLAFAQRQGANCVVFTFIDRNTLNVDYYNAQGIVVDLGCLYR